MPPQLATPIDLPGLVLPQQHGLWSSAYHLLHPGNGDVAEDTESDEMQIWPVPYEDPWLYPGQQLGRTPQSMPITGSGGFVVAQRIAAGLSYFSDCCADLGCFYNCQPGLDCPGPSDGSSLPKVNDSFEEFYIPSSITARVACTTFGFSANDYWGKAERALRSNREKTIEDRLWEGDCVTDSLGNTVNPYLSDGSATVLGGSLAQSSSVALKMLNQSLSACNCGEAGMIHAPIPVVDEWMDKGVVEVAYVDYGDGMGMREVIHTRVKKHIVVAGSGYSGLGPNGGVPGVNQAWIYSTPMVYLMWDKIRFSSEENNMSGATQVNINRTEAVAEQIVGSFYKPCCNYAVLVDICT